MNVSPTYGGIFGGQTLTFTGESFGATAGTVTLEGRACEVKTWTDSQVTAVTPPRMTNGRRIATRDDVQAVVTPAVGGPFSATYTYRVPVLTLALNQIRDSIAAIDPDADPHYNNKVTASQIVNYHRDVEDSGAAYPQIMVYAADTDYSGTQNEPYGFYTGRTPCIVTATTRLSEAVNWDEETRGLASDICRAIIKVAVKDPNGMSIEIDKVLPGQEDVPEFGSLGTLVVEFTIKWKHIDLNWNSTTEGE